MGFVRVGHRDRWLVNYACKGLWALGRGFGQDFGAVAVAGSGGVGGKMDGKSRNGAATATMKYGAARINARGLVASSRISNAGGRSGSIPRGQPNSALAHARFTASSSSLASARVARRATSGFLRNRRHAVASAASTSPLSPLGTSPRT